MTCSAGRTGPTPVTQRQKFIDTLTYTASLRTRIETVDLDHRRSVLRSDMPKLIDERAEGQVIHFAAPQAYHTCQVQIFDANGRVSPAQFMTRFPLPVITTVADPLMASLQILAALAPMTRTLDAAGQSP